MVIQYLIYYDRAETAHACAKIRTVVPPKLTATDPEVTQHLIFCSLCLKGTGSRSRKQTCYLYNLYCCPHVAIVFCRDSGGWGESTTKLLPKIH